MLVVHGPKRIAPSPVPVIWEQLPVTDGILRAEITKIYAPDIAKIVIALGFSENIFFILRNPFTKNGMQTAPQAIQSVGGRYPSIICIAPAVCPAAKTDANKILIFQILFPCLSSTDTPFFFGDCRSAKHKAIGIYK